MENKKSEKGVITPKDAIPGEILYANLHFVNTKREKIIVKEQIISRDYDKEMQTIYTKEDDLHCFNKWKVKQDKLVLTSLDIIVSLGYKNKPNGGYTKVEGGVTKEERQQNGSFI